MTVSVLYRGCSAGITVAGYGSGYIFSFILNNELRSIWFAVGCVPPVDVIYADVGVSDHRKAVGVLRPEQSVDILGEFESPL